MRLLQHQMSQLLIVDIQDKVLGLTQNGADINKAAGLLIQSAKLLHIPILATELAPGELGPMTAALKSLLGGEAPIIDKTHFSAYRHGRARDLLEAQRDQGRRGQIVLAGLEAHVAVTQTALDLIGDGFEVYVAADAVGSRAPSSREVALRRLERSGALLVDAEMVIFEWLEKAGTPEHKSVSALMK